MLKLDKDLISKDISLPLVGREQSAGACFRVDTHRHTILRFGEQPFPPCWGRLGGRLVGTSPLVRGLFIARAIDKGVAKVYGCLTNRVQKRYIAPVNLHMEMPGKEGLVKIPGLLPVFMVVFHVGLGK